MGTDGAARRLLSGWGRVTPTAADVFRPRDEAEVEHALQVAGPRGILARGLGRSYGDAAQNGGGVVLDMTGFEGVRAFDPRTGAVRVRAGTSLDALLRAFVPRGWFLPVSPGTRFVTVGGAVASDVHGKNHHRDSGFCAHVTSLRILTPSGGTVEVGPDDPTGLFWATAGGMGLTGIVLEASIRLLRIATSSMAVDTERADDLDDLLSRMAEGDDRYRYSVAWVDTTARGRRLGRAVLTRGDHAPVEALPDRRRSAPLAYRAPVRGSVPPGIPSLIHLPLVRAFNEAWFRKAPRSEVGRLHSISSFFHPLDAVANWNRIYGRRGFVQHQFVVPVGREDVVRTALERFAAAGSPSFLTVLKRFGRQQGFLAFPMPGWTLATDLPAWLPGLGPLLDALDELVAEAGGRVYLTKDARLRPHLIDAMYPDLDRWREVRERADPNRMFRSDLDRRLALGSPARQRRAA